MNEIESERVLDTLSKMMIDTKDSEDENHKAEKIYDDIYGKINGEYYAALTKMPSKENHRQCKKSFEVYGTVIEVPKT